MARLGGRYAILSEGPGIYTGLTAVCLVPRTRCKARLREGTIRHGMSQQKKTRLDQTVVATFVLMRHMKRTTGRAMCQLNVKIP